MSKQNKYKTKAIAENLQKGGRRPKKNNNHGFGNGNGKFGKKAARIKRAAERAQPIDASKKFGAQSNQLKLKADGINKD